MRRHPASRPLRQETALRAADSAVRPAPRWRPDAPGPRGPIPPARRTTTRSSSDAIMTYAPLRFRSRIEQPRQLDTLRGRQLQRDILDVAGMGGDPRFVAPLPIAGSSAAARTTAQASSPSISSTGSTASTATAGATDAELIGAGACTVVRQTAVIIKSVASVRHSRPATERSWNPARWCDWSRLDAKPFRHAGGEMIPEQAATVQTPDRRRRALSRFEGSRLPRGTRRRPRDAARGRAAASATIRSDRRTRHGSDAS